MMDPTRSACAPRYQHCNPFPASSVFVAENSNEISFLQRGTKEDVGGRNRLISDLPARASAFHVRLRHPNALSGHPVPQKYSVDLLPIGGAARYCLAFQLLVKKRCIILRSISSVIRPPDRATKRATSRSICS